LKFLWDTGARLSDVAGVRIEDINIKESRGVFDASYTKRNKSRPFKLDEEFYGELKTFITQ
jgi:integrase